MAIASTGDAPISSLNQSEQCSLWLDVFDDASPLSIIPQDHFMQRMNVERVAYRKLFRDIKLHVGNGLKVYQATRNDCDAKFYELFDSLQFLLESTQEHQETLVKGCSK